MYYLFSRLQYDLTFPDVIDDIFDKIIDDLLRDLSVLGDNDAVTYDVGAMEEAVYIL